MPNHIQNRIIFIGENKEIENVSNHIKKICDDGTEVPMDFNKIKPMPIGMDIQVSEGVKMWVEIITGQLDFASLFQQQEDPPSIDSFISRLSASTALDYLTGKRTGNVKDLSDDDFSHFIQCLKNYREHGSMSWYEWSNDNWGTKWNAYGQPDNRNTGDTMFFQTAWKSPVWLIQELSRMFPLVKIQLTYADEDSGSNTGRLLFQNGVALEAFNPESQSKEAYDLYFELHPSKKSNYKLVGDKYEYVDEE